MSDKHENTTEKNVPTSTTSDALNNSSDLIINKTEYFKLLDEAMRDTTLEEAHPTVNTQESSEQENSPPASTHRISETRLNYNWLYAACALIFVNLTAIGVYKFSGTDTVPREVARKELEEVYGDDARLLINVDDLFNSKYNYTGIDDPDFAAALDEINSSFEEIEDYDPVIEEPFKAEDFRFLDEQFVYNPPRQSVQR